MPFLFSKVVNRDLSVAVLQWFSNTVKKEKESGGKRRTGNKGKGPKGPFTRERPKDINGLYVLEGLAASGLRSIRYAQEVRHICTFS